MGVFILLKKTESIGTASQSKVNRKKYMHTYVCVSVYLSSDAFHLCKAHRPTLEGAQYLASSQDVAYYV